MNDPWLPLIAALSGQRTATPSTWPVRNVHRIDCCLSVTQVADRRRTRSAGGASAPAPVAR
jgi:hypothetical protein